jgi:hypothetical protein
MSLEIQLLQQNVYNQRSSFYSKIYQIGDLVFTAKHVIKDIAFTAKCVLLEI